LKLTSKISLELASAQVCYYKCVETFSHIIHVAFDFRTTFTSGSTFGKSEK